LNVSQHEQVANLLIHRLGEVMVPEADRVERLWCDRAYDIVDFSPQLLTGFGCCSWNGDDDAGGLLLPQRLDPGVHGRPGRQTIIHKNDRAAANIRRRATAAVQTLAPRQLLLLACRDGVDYVVRYAEPRYELIIEHAHPAGRDRAHASSS
jgi:hypothetical protein